MFVIKFKPIFILKFIGFSAIIFVSLFLYFDYNSKSTSGTSIANDYTIIIDAGHGGEDGGAEAADGTFEKDINLDISKRLNEILLLSGYKCIMTREDDSSTDGTERFNKARDIKNRIKLIEEQDKGLLISVHMNKFPESKYFGAQMFYSISNQNGRILAETLQDLFKNNLQKDNIREAKPIPNSVFLFKKVKVPAVLAECGFLSNPAELAKLKTPEYKQSVALVLYLGIVKYMSFNDV